MNTSTGQVVSQDLKTGRPMFSMGMIKANNLASSMERINYLKKIIWTHWPPQ